ncbi:tetratricopeptide repeat protein [Novipirellula galeiformis]|uniref:Tetratricopeptide repeat protein n=1 Tax=Novipirellula galeiformis TaxID=2528004 RepID=A0A5C6CJE0_9BACT|nr:tetratricopeptide repeat protein [Novipirellula galeiformis]TWU24963.1 tetratricopeptide repeat protein [Novipirellula galeiformis]
MSNSNPFSETYAYDPITPQPTSTKRVLVVLAVVAFLFALLCAGILSVAYVSVQRMASPAADFELDERRDAFAQDEVDFNQSLDRFVGVNAHVPDVMDPEIQDFLDASIESLENGAEVPFSLPLFIEAVAKSEQSHGALGIINRLSLRNWLTQYQPSPDAINRNVRVLNTRYDATKKLAVLDMLNYSAGSQAESIQWFLVKEPSGWKLYDWQRLEFGRRMSDEYASYLRGAAPLDDGYDTALAKLNEAEIEWYDGEVQKAKREMRRAVKHRMLPQDRPSFLLQAAYTWMRLEQYDDAIEVLKQIQEPDSLWGVWPSLAICYTNLGDIDEAQLALQKAQQQSPNHPNGFWIASLIHDHLDRDDEAAVAVLRALKICPRDPDMFYSVLRRRRVEDLPPLLEIVIDNHDELQWTSLLNHASSSSQAWGQGLVEELKRHPNSPLGLVEIAQGKLDWRNEEFNAAAQHFLASEAVAETEFIKSIARDNLLEVRLADNQFDALFTDASDPDLLLRDLVLRAFEDELYCDAEKLLAALDHHAKNANSAWDEALKGWALHSIGDWDKSIPRFDAFLAWREQQATRSADAPNESLDATGGAAEENPSAEEDGWLDDTAAYYLCDALLELGRASEVVERWPDDLWKHDQVGDFLLQDHHASKVAAFLQSTEDNVSDSLRIQRWRAQAHQAMLRGETEQVDSMHLAAIELARSVYGADDNYFTYKLVRERARDLVRNRTLRDPESVNRDNLGDDALHPILVHAAIREAIRLGDNQQLALWRTIIDEAEMEPSDGDAALHYELGDYYRSLDEMDQAIRAYQVCLQHADEAWWNRTRCIQGAAYAMLEAGNVDAAKQWFATNPIPNSNVESEALIDLATGNVDSLTRHLEDAGKINATDWLNQHLEAATSLNQLEQPRFRSLLETYPLEIPSLSPPASGFLIQREAGPLDPQQISTQLQGLFGERFEFVAVENDAKEPDSSDDDMQAYLFRSERGQRILFSSGKPQYRVDGVSRWLAERLNAPVERTTVAILDHRPHPKRRLFRIAEERADADAIAFSGSGETRIWSGPELERRLTWNDRKPISPAAMQPALEEMPRPDAVPIETQYVEIERWDSQLKEAGGSLNVTLTLAVGNTRERIACELFKVDPEEYDLYIRPQRDSVLIPIVKAGTAYTCGPSLLSL